ncbi:NAD(P)H-hydrate dehydratase [Chondrinema litorale]|uniref:NAD(P)H-hydrate dehydratase n=1 Tax=Chondrinema litorale TaxID=2994555 RepID=UPI002544AC3D|nr:NAD(P)H-hydrate dehydratase [Chondrinema litorale]UZR92902.1 NAD(P)H-hydrate dehydratase [Chondrinema litorale]
MKILSAKQTRFLDNYTIEHEPILSIDLMERASERFTNWLIKKYNLTEKSQRKIRIFAGVGNNGGDGLAVARMLLQWSINAETFIVRFSDKASEDFKTNEARLGKIDEPMSIYTIGGIPDLHKDDLIIDAIFGSGLSRPLKGIAADVVSKINASEATVVSIDIPSGLYCDDINDDEIKIEADEVLSFQLPKLAFLLVENERYIKNWELTDIGLLAEGIEKTESNYYYLNKEFIASKFKSRGRFSHKGTYGHLLIMAGSKGKFGAAQLSIKAALKSGAGLLTAFVPACAFEIIQIAIPEAMCLTDIHQEVLTEVPDIESYKALAIGPGIGTSMQTRKMMKTLLEKLERPSVFDADALNILAKEPDLLKKLPANSILTPHPKEFERLAGKSKNSLEQIQKLQKFCEENQVVTVLKGAYTAICNTDGTVYFNSTGNPGMATGGSGDVLTGIIAALLSSGYEPYDAARIGVYLHGMAGDFAAKELSMTAMSAGDIIANLGKAYLEFE